MWHLHKKEKESKWGHFQEWCADHIGSAAGTEPAGTELIFRHSEEQYGLHYTHYLGDGDSKSYSWVKNAEPPVYDGTETAKLEYCGHVQKHMDRHLTDKVAKLKSTTVNNNGRQVKGTGSKSLVSGSFRVILVQPSGTMQMPEMKKAIWATRQQRNQQHITQQQRFMVSTKETKRWWPIPAVMSKAIKPVFETLTSEFLLQKCVHDRTQYHSTTWSTRDAPKQHFVGVAA